MLLESIFWLGMTIYLEAQGESDEGRIMVAMSILNRSHKKQITIKEVVLQKKQYSCWNEYNETGNFPKIKYPNDLIECTEFALKALTLYSNGERKKYVDHYFNDEIPTPSWAKDMEFIAKVGKHLFYKG